jgi:outer membrane protein OmpA-like peptidoglycan-associated protein
MKLFQNITLLVSAMLLGCMIPAEATPLAHERANIPTVSNENGQERQLLSPGTLFFVPHWWLRAQGGTAYDVGEASFTQLLSPAVQLSLGYQPTELLGIRASLNGLWARNRYAYPEAKYQWYFLQPTVGLELNLTSLLLGRQPDRVWYVYAFADGGVAYAYNNEEAQEADKCYGIDFQKIWSDYRWNPVGRGGLGVDYQVTDNLAIGAELSAAMLPDHFNSKRGRGDNRDWHFNALVGAKLTLGYRHGRTEPRYAEVPEPVAPAVQPVKKDTFINVPIEKISFNVNIYFLINQSIIRSNQIPKLTRLLQYLHQHPRAFIRLSGYADKETGTHEINLRLSRERSQAVSQYLQDVGIEEWRIRRFAKGDMVQPFDIPEDNRVCICYVYDPDNPVPQEFK